MAAEPAAQWRNPYIALKRPEPLRIVRTSVEQGQLYMVGTHRVVRMGAQSTKETPIGQPR